MGSNKIIQNIVRCKCCLGEDELKDLWTVYYNDGEREIYGKMLSDCFALNWEPPTMNSDSDIENICSSCVSKLHDAISFKKEIFLSAKLLLEEINKNDSWKTVEDDSDDSIETEYLNIEDLEDEEITKEKSGTELDSTEEIDKALNVNPKSECGEEDDLKECAEAVKNKPALQNKVPKLPKILKRSHNTLKKALPSNESTTFKEKISPQVNEIIDSDKNTIEPAKESGRATRKRKKGSSEVKVEEHVEEVQSNTIPQNKATSYTVPMKEKHKEIDFKVPALNETQKKRKNVKNMEKEDNLVDSVKSNETLNVLKKKRKNHSEGDTQKCEEAVQTKRLSRKAVNDALEKCKMSASSEPVEFIKPNQSKLYTKEDFQKCLEAVKNRTMSRAQACRTYNVPMSTLYVAMKKCLNETDKKSDTQKAQENLDCLINYTNATPFAGFLRAGYGCLFCTKIFEDPTHLKTHCLKTHSKQRVVVKPSKSVKLDVTGLKCDICEEKFEKLESVLLHLNSVHGKQIYTHIREFLVPFKFDSEVLKCAVCSETFHCFKLLNEHMNSSHFKNFECNECGRGFISKVSFHSHRLRHETGVFKCKFCLKEFSSKVQCDVHERSAHRYSYNKYICGYCSERFTSLQKKKQHELIKHDTEQRLFNCKACGKSFRDLRVLRTHEKAFHLKMRPHKCEKCEFSAYSQQNLKKHMITHTGEKNFTCDICSKSFGLKYSLREHMRIHANDRRFKCEHCRRSFVHKCALKKHMLAKHHESK